MAHHYHIADVRYIIWEMPISLVFRLVLQYQRSARLQTGKKAYTPKESDKIEDFLGLLGEHLGKDKT